MRDLLIRPAVLAEKADLEALQLRAALSNPGDRDAMIAHPDAIEVPAEQIAAGRAFVAERNGAIVGFSAVEPRSDGQTELDALFVDPDTRYLGIGRKLVEYCVEVARRNGSTALHVIGNPHAETFYLRCGFKQTGTVETRFGTGLLLMKEV
jgi:N-acetylglutamate synthase-like GNAT family acetyltransferase